MENDSSELASMIATFIKQNGHNRKKVTVVNYAHGVNGIYDIDIPVTSIHILHQQPIHFTGTAGIKRQDLASERVTNVNVRFNGVAFFDTDVWGDYCPRRIFINQIN